MSPTNSRRGLNPGARYVGLNRSIGRLLTQFLDFARERVPDQDVTIMPPGSGAWPWQVWYLDGMNARKQASQVAVGIISRAPSYNSVPPESPNDIMVDLVCVQAPSGGSSKGSHD